jgi:hypothetical protein
MMGGPRAYNAPMQPFGSDRLRVTDDQRIVLSSRIDKGWTARVPKTLTSSEHPGTAVLCNDEYYEVVEASVQPQGSGFRYVLVPWREEHAIRVADRYDEESEARRIAEHAAGQRRDRQARGATFLGIFAGHLPAVVQERMAFELGFLPARFSLLSLLLPMGVVAWVVYSTASGVIGGTPHPLSPLKILLGAYLFAESAFRFSIIGTQSRPVGSAAGVLLYLLAYAAGPKDRMTSPFAVSKGLALFTLPREEDQALRDEMVMKAAYATLLTPAEQHRLAARFDFDYRRHAYGIAWVLLVIGVIGAGSAIATLRHGVRVTAILSLAAGAALAVEQLVRLIALGRGPAGSALAIFVRPLMKRLL